jgi:hypothetical protein
MNEGREYSLPAPGLVVTFEGRDCLVMPLFPGEEQTVTVGPYTLTIRTPGISGSDGSSASRAATTNPVRPHAYEPAAGSPHIRTVCLEDVRAAHTELGPAQPAEVHWASGWYVRKRHVYEMQVARADGSVPAICSELTAVYPNGREHGRHAVPLADSPEVMALPGCKICLRKGGGMTVEERRRRPVPAAAIRVPGATMTWYPNERPGENRPERYCPNEHCVAYTLNRSTGTHCADCNFYFMSGAHPNPRSAR